MVVLALLVSASTLPGCYRHVVKAKGMGADTVRTYEPNVSGTAAAAIKRKESRFSTERDGAIRRKSGW